uniref:Heavy metal translocating P-type ATPase n=1 Tax=Cyanothece sp. (strain PCC 7425 / ATCC 29141) TaxID=395961 RepID=B8HLX2_CYAP4
MLNLASVQSNLDSCSEQNIYQVVHQIQGRVRLIIPRLKKDPIYASQLQHLVISVPGVIAGRINALSASLVVHYDVDIVQPTFLQQQLLLIIQQLSRADLSQLFPHSLEYEIVHITEGRWRLRIPCLINNPDYASRLTWLLETRNWQIQVRINLFIGAVVIDYRTDLISPQQLQQDLFTLIQQAHTVELPPGLVVPKVQFRPEISWLERVGLPIASLMVALLVRQFMFPIPPVVVGSLVAIAAMPFFTRLIDLTLKQGRLDADLLDALWLSLYTVQGDFVAPALMISMMESGEALRDTTARTNQQQVLDVLNHMGRYARIERDGKEEHIPLPEVQVGDRVIVYAGELIPVSGRVLRGSALVDEHQLTGESALVTRAEGQVVHASTLLLEGKLYILAKRVGDQTRAGLVAQLLQQAPVHDTRIEDYSASISNAVVVPALCLSGGIFALTGDVSRALAPLHLDFSQGIRLAVPTTVLSALTYAARHGIYIRSGRALEMLARVDTVIFDKTGTLTEGNAAVVAIRTMTPEISVREVLILAASAEQENSHPVSGAVLRYAATEGVQPLPCERWDYRIGMGIMAQIDGQQVLVGSSRLMQQEQVNMDAIYQDHSDLQTNLYSLVYIARNGQLLGVILYTDPLRPGIAPLIADLHRQGISTYILTGDRQTVAAAVADQVGITPNHTFAEVLPRRKVEVIQELQAQQKTVAFVGEGINDAAALAHADVAISFAEGNDIARETADIVLLEADLGLITQAISIARRSMEIIYQNTAIVTVPNLSVVLAGIFFALDPVLGVIISNGSILVAELNSFRPLFEPEEELHSCG